MVGLTSVRVVCVTLQDIHLIAKSLPFFAMLLLLVLLVSSAAAEGVEELIELVRPRAHHFPLLPPLTQRRPPTGQRRR